MSLRTCWTRLLTGPISPINVNINIVSKRFSLVWANNFRTERKDKTGQDTIDSFLFNRGDENWGMLFELACENCARVSLQVRWAEKSHAIENKTNKQTNTPADCSYRQIYSILFYHTARRKTKFVRIICHWVLAALDEIGSLNGMACCLLTVCWIFYWRKSSIACHKYDTIKIRTSCCNHLLWVPTGNVDWVVNL